MTEPTRTPDLEAILRDARTIAVVGAHPDPAKAAFYVPDYLKRQNYRVLPVNPDYPDEHLWGVTTSATLADLGEPVDLVVLFRRSEHVPDHVDDILALRPRPAVVWLQEGIRHEEAAERLRSAGIVVVQDACMLKEHRRFGLDPIVHA